MTNKTMPERITVRHNTCIRKLSIAEEKIGLLLPEDILEDEYVRADMLLGDPNEPLVDGQYRWVRVDEGEEWEPVAILKSQFCDRLVYFLTGEVQGEYTEDCYEMGPVIRPPEGK